MRKMAAVFLVLGALATSGQTSPDRYVEGQIWEYRARPVDAGSLVKIQRVEDVGSGVSAERVYHVSIIGIRMANPHMPSILPHMPVSRQTLDASVTRQASSATGFPPLSLVDEGIAHWREAQGGIFTIPLAQIVGILDDQTRDLPPPPSEAASPST